MPKTLQLGMNIHNTTYSVYRDTLMQNLDDCQELGVSVVRYNNAGCTESHLAEIRQVAAECHRRGMQLMLCVDNPFWVRDNGETLEEVEAYFENHMYTLASSLQGEVDIYQIFNETDVACLHGDITNITLPHRSGLELGEYDYMRVDGAIAGMKGGLRGLKAGYPHARSSVNFSWWHTAVIYEMYRQGCRWDVIGLHWYSDGEEISSIDKLVADVCAHIPDCDIMLTETNHWMNLHERWDESKRDLMRCRDTRNALQAEWVPSFLQKLYDLEEPRLKAVIFYELLDEPRFEREAGNYHGESHFGFIECDEDGGNRVKKPVFEAVRRKFAEWQ